MKHPDSEDLHEFAERLIEWAKVIIIAVVIIVVVISLLGMIL